MPLITSRRPPSKKSQPNLSSSSSIASPSKSSQSSSPSPSLQNGLPSHISGSNQPLPSSFQPSPAPSPSRLSSLFPKRVKSASRMVIGRSGAVTPTQSMSAELQSPPPPKRQKSGKRKATARGPEAESSQALPKRSSSFYKVGGGKGSISSPSLNRYGLPQESDTETEVRPASALAGGKKGKEPAVRRRRPGVEDVQEEAVLESEGDLEDAGPRFRRPRRASRMSQEYHESSPEAGAAAAGITHRAAASPSPDYFQTPCASPAPASDTESQRGSPVLSRGLPGLRVATGAGSRGGRRISSGIVSDGLESVDEMESPVATTIPPMSPYRSSPPATRRSRPLPPAPAQPSTPPLMKTRSKLVKAKPPHRRRQSSGDASAESVSAAIRPHSRLSLEDVERQRAKAYARLSAGAGSTSPEFGRSPAGSPALRQDLLPSPQPIPRKELSEVPSESTALEEPDWVTVRDFILSQLGRAGLNRNVTSAVPTSLNKVLEKEERLVWQALRDGVVAIRLLKHISNTVPIPDPNRHDSPIARRENVLSFIRGLRFLGLPPSYFFEPTDLEGRNGASGWARVLQCFLAIKDWTLEAEGKEMPTEEYASSTGQEQRLPLVPRGPSSSSGHNVAFSVASTSMTRGRNGHDPSVSTSGGSSFSWERDWSDGRSDSRMSDFTSPSTAPTSVSVLKGKGFPSRTPGSSDSGPVRDDVSITSHTTATGPSEPHIQNRVHPQSPAPPPRSPARPRGKVRDSDTPPSPVVSFAPDSFESFRKSVGTTKIYGDRRLSESAIDILASVDETEEPASPPRDEVPLSSPKRKLSIRPAQKSAARPAPPVLPRRSMSVSPTPSIESTSPKINARQVRRFSSDAATRPPSQLRLRAATPLSDSDNEPVSPIDVRRGLPGLKPRVRRASDVAPHMGRSFSTSVVPNPVPGRRTSEPNTPKPSPPPSRTPSPEFHESPIQPNSLGLGPAPASLHRVPFPRSTSDSPTTATAKRTKHRLQSNAANVRPRQHKRWNSELNADTPFIINAREVRPLRSRHDSIAAEDGSELGNRRARLAVTEMVPPSPSDSSEPVFVEDRGRELRGPRFGRSVSTTGMRQKLVIGENNEQVTYQLGDCIGKGQFGSVYRALNLNSGRVVAIKRIKLGDRGEEEIKQLSNEVDLLKNLSHPGVVKYEGFLREEKCFNIVLEYAENGSLLQTLKNYGCLPESLAASYTVKILEGLNYLHSKGVVHCDLKAANILTTKNGNVKLSDFGVSLNLNAVRKTTTMKAEAAGTPNWMAPEIIELKGSTPQSDIWSLACTIVEIITGHPPYWELGVFPAMFHIVEDPLPPIPECSEELSSFLLACFAKNPKMRPLADQLFEHSWLRKFWQGHKALRSQESVPFLRRISSEMRRVEVSELQEPNAPGLERVASAPVASTSIGGLELPTLARVISASPQAGQTDLPAGITFPSKDMASGGSSQDGNSAIGISRNGLQEPSLGIPRTSTDDPDYDPVRPHSFVKTTFSKAVDCKLCRTPVRKHAVLCEDCGLICHSRCAEFAMLPCDLRAALRVYGDVGSPPVSPGVGPPSPGFPGQLGSKFNIGLGLPRKLKLSSTSNTSSEALPLPGTSPPRKLHLGDILLHRRPRTPDDRSSTMHESGGTNSDMIPIESSTEGPGELVQTEIPGVEDEISIINDDANRSSGTSSLPPEEEDNDEEDEDEEEGGRVTPTPPGGSSTPLEYRKQPSTKVYNRGNAEDNRRRASAPLLTLPNGGRRAVTPFEPGRKSEDLSAMNRRMLMKSNASSSGGGISRQSLDHSGGGGGGGGGGKKGTRWFRDKDKDAKRHHRDSENCLIA